MSGVMGLSYDQRLYLEEQARGRAARPAADPHQFEAAVDALREAQMVERLAQLRMSRARVAAIGRARKLHVAEWTPIPTTTAE